jgi:hypothetical protein
MNWAMARSSRASMPLSTTKACAGQLGRVLEAHQAEALADLEVLLGLECEVRLAADHPLLAVALFVEAFGHIVGGQVGDADEDRLELLRQRLLGGFGFRHLVLEGGDFRHHGARVLGPWTSADRSAWRDRCASPASPASWSGRRGAWRPAPTISADKGGRFRRARPRSKASGLSRIHLASNMVLRR